MSQGSMTAPGALTRGVVEATFCGVSLPVIPKVVEKFPIIHRVILFSFTGRSS